MQTCLFCPCVTLCWSAKFSPLAETETGVCSLALTALVKTKTAPLLNLASLTETETVAFFTILSGIFLHWSILKLSGVFLHCIYKHLNCICSNQSVEEQPGAPRRV